MRGSGDDSDVVLRERAASRYLGVSRRTLRRWRSTGGGPPAIRVAGGLQRGRWGYRRADLDTWIREHPRR